MKLLALRIMIVEVNLHAIMDIALKFVLLEVFGVAIQKASVLGLVGIGVVLGVRIMLAEGRVEERHVAHQIFGVVIQ
jgi:hypothetical protein